MSNFSMLNSNKPISSLCPTNGRHAVGDGAFLADSVLAVCHLQGEDDIYYYSTTFSGGPGVTKCPPDRGSSDWVTDSPAPIFSASPFPLESTSPQTPPAPVHFPRDIVYPPTPPLEHAEAGADVEPLAFPTSVPPTSAIAIPKSMSSRMQLATPPLTPENTYDGEGGGSVAAISAKQKDAALDFLTALFPRNGLTALPYAKSVSISAPNLGAAFDGVVLNLPGQPKTLYVDGQSAENVNLRESIVALLDLADERLECSALVIALPRSSPALGELLHSLMYVGGTVVTKPPFEVDAAYVLVGMEL
ncbi:hypothetical protein PUNSTDRAFT_131955 [Punctularia strigosozonata HHB-11173 SS5]|uniref:uncharacterized protein n=1 Tax=Punctularia strigosozonata (strain HHB-11173) TaxID=741275 RepID=UPI0004417C43|nr:uncharacterized protein PUNSTDRAFT_131955 [Punctularia strigosozonata HHB-11173 SS5]EIN11800.1 hypothetical protein PUNSTDRAFT_131955 [Punctularia strigosozonata HHB-11173 SS5]